MHTIRKDTNGCWAVVNTDTGHASDWFDKKSDALKEARRLDETPAAPERWMDDEYDPEDDEQARLEHLARTEQER